MNDYVNPAIVADKDREIENLREELSLCESTLQNRDQTLEWHVAEIEKLQAFKDYVHQRLDEAGVPVDPESPHKAAGCRIGGRLDEIFAQLQQAYERIVAQQTVLDLDKAIIDACGRLLKLLKERFDKYPEHTHIVLTREEYEQCLNSSATPES